ncbi:putative aflatoxin biosynthesis ketoreductase nor-1 [Thozetella sp. PMI_491]|nr:putative aflatoxin biosynthesis ketoreductase nor-1 [Thozetella sp. PMI_491]
MSTVLITGANKGLGRSLTEHYLQRPNYTVIATVRNIDSEQAKSLPSIPVASGSRLIVLKVDSQSETDAADAVKSLVAQGVSKLDIVIANAGIYTLEAFVPVKDMKSADLTEHFDINATGVVRLFQAVLPLLEKAERPRFMALSSSVATIGGMEALATFTLPSYGASKAALNFLTRRIHFEHPSIVAFVVHPG